MTLVFKELIFGMLFLKRLPVEFDRRALDLGKVLSSKLLASALLKEFVEEKTSYGETFSVPKRARWHEPWTDENGDEVPALKDHRKQAEMRETRDG